MSAGRVDLKLPALGWRNKASIGLRSGRARDWSWKCKPMEVTRGGQQRRPCCNN